MFDDDPHLSHAEVEHGADVDDEEEGTDNRQGKHWEQLRMKTRMRTRRKKRMTWMSTITKETGLGCVYETRLGIRTRMRVGKIKNRDDRDLKSLSDNSLRWEMRKPPHWCPASSLHPL